MNPIKKSRTLAISGIIAIFFLLIAPAPAKSLSIELPFGGLASFSFPCTCSANLYVWFTPLYLGGPAVLAGPLVYSPYSTIPYANYMTGLPGIWHLGSYIPGIQACWMYVGIACVPIPSYGIMTKVGTNRYF